MKKSVVVVLPVYQKEFNKDELISLKVLRKRLYGKYEICIITHEGLVDTINKNKLFNGYKIKTFDNKFFTYQGYNKLLKSSFFYSAFKEFDYMLIYQTDCLVFGSSAGYWIDKNYDYVGSPWIQEKKGKLSFDNSGNGGLSLRKIKTFIEITKKSKYLKWKLFLFLKNILPSIFVLLHKLFISRDYPRYHIGCRNEDIFFSHVSKQIFSNFRKAEIKDAISFSFEKYPEFCFKENDNKLPFGCHAWQKYNKSFWEKFI